MDLTKVKKHLNIDDSFVDDDIYISQLIECATTIVEKHINCKITDEDGNIPTPLKQAIYLLVANFYANRESVAFASSGEIPLSYNYILDLYKNYNQ